MYPVNILNNEVNRYCENFVGKGRALGVGEVKFTGQVLQTVKKVTYHISLKKLILRKLVMGIADGIMKADGKPIYEVKDMKVGLFTYDQ